MSIYGLLPLHLRREWGNLRRDFIKQRPLCLACLKLGKAVYGDVVDHIIPHRGDPKLLLDWRNLQTLCHKCHSMAKQRSEVRGYDIEVGTDGFPTSPDSPWGKQGGRR